MYILSQVLVVMSDAVYIASALSKKKKNVVFYLILSTMFFCFHYICLSGWTGAAIAGIELVFLVLMYILEIKNKTQFNMILSLSTAAVTIILSVLTWGGLISLIPMIAMLIYLISMICKNVIIVKAGVFIRLTLNAIYMWLLASYFGAILSLVILAFTIVGIVKDYKEKQKETINE